MKPLEGMTVLDFTQAFSGPYCAMNLADYGARIIKVERKGVGDQSRYWAPFNKDGYSGYYAVYNRNKESISIDMRSEEGKDNIKKLFSEVDVVLENFKYGSLDKLGLGYDVAKEINPEIIFASITGFGHTGPMKKKSAYDNIIEGMCGFMEVTGFPENPPLRSGASVGDSYTGLMMDLAIAVAYYYKLRTGKGQRLDVSMLDTMFSTIEDAVLAFSVDGRILERTGNARPNQFAPYDTYACKDGEIAVGIIDDKMWESFCDAFGCKELKEEEKYASNELRCQNIDSLTLDMNRIFSEQTLEEAMEKMQRYGLPAAPVLVASQAMKHPQLVDRGMVVTIDDAGLGKYQAFGVPVKFSETPGAIEKGAPKLGENTKDILKEIGYTDKNIDSLIEAGVVEQSE